MKIFTFLLIAACTSLFAIDDGTPGLDQTDIKALRDWINTKRQVTVKELGGNLSISGEVRAELQSTNEKKNGIKQRGSGGQVKHTAMRTWDIEVDLMLDYRTDHTWATIKLKFDNDAGTVGGTFDKLSLDRAFLGGRIVNGDTYNMDLEIGRRVLGYTFDSKVMFGSFMDGILYKYDQALEVIGDLYFHGGPFVVNETLDQYAYVGELGLLNIGRTGFYTKIASVCWDTKHTHNKKHNNAFRFIPIQWIWGYKFKPFGKITTLYAAGLYNPRAHGTAVSYGKRQAWAWYTGFSVGELRKRWDWSFNVNYQWVQLQAVPDFDGSGIGRGNAAKTGLYSKKSKGEGAALTTGQGVGSGNYKGFAIEFLYLLTNNITVYQAWRQSINQDPSIKPTFSYKQYEIEFIYGF